MRVRMALISLGLFFLLTHGVRAADAGVDLRYVEPSTETGSSMAVVVGQVPLAHTAQLLPLDARGQIIGKGNPARQIEAVLKHLEAALRGAGSRLDRVVKINVYVASLDVVDEVQRAFAKTFAGAGKPAVSFVVTALAHPDALVALDGVAVARGKAEEGEKFIHLDVLPGLPGSSHVAIQPVGGTIYVAGQAEKGVDLVQSTRRTMESLRVTLAHLGRRDFDIIQIKAFLRPASDTTVVAKEIARSFGPHPVPPLVFVEWKDAGPIEIELIAAAGKSTDLPAERIDYITPPGMKPSPVFSRVARVNRGKRVYISGLYAPSATDAEGQITAIFDALGRLLEKTGSDFRHLAKATYYVTDDKEVSRKLNELRPKYYDPRWPPAASKATVAGVGRKDKSITLDMIAVTAK